MRSALVMTVVRDSRDQIQCYGGSTGIRGLNKEPVPSSILESSRFAEDARPYHRNKRTLIASALAVTTNKLE